MPLIVNVKRNGAIKVTVIFSPTIWLCPIPSQTNYFAINRIKILDTKMPSLHQVFRKVQGLSMQCTQIDKMHTNMHNNLLCNIYTVLYIVEADAICNCCFAVVYCHFTLISREDNISYLHYVVKTL